MYGDNTMKLSASKCARDLQGDAKRLKERIDVNDKFIDALENLACNDGIHQIDDRNDRKTLFAIYGDFKIKHPSLMREYEQLLQMIEEEG